MSIARRMIDEGRNLFKSAIAHFFCTNIDVASSLAYTNGKKVTTQECTE